MQWKDIAGTIKKQRAMLNTVARGGACIFAVASRRYPRTTLCPLTTQACILAILLLFLGSPSSGPALCQRVRSLLLPQSGGEYVASLLSRRSSCRRRDAKRRLPRRERASAAVADAFELCATSRRHDSSARQEHQQQPPHRHPPRACRGRKGARRRCRGTEGRSPTLVQSSGSETKR